ncbi:MAG: hypothetical protein ABW139_20730 [Candidatus Thiodiazotropha sp. DIVDIV]
MKMKMKMKRKILTFITALFGISGLVVAAVPFIGSLNVSERALANRPHITIDHIGEGESEIITSEGATYSMTFMVYRSLKGDVRVWKIPVYKGKIILPDIHWGRWAMLCDEFTLDKVKNVFRCLDEHLQQYSWVTDEMLWDVDGKNLGKFTEDMILAEGVHYSKYFVVGRPKIKPNQQRNTDFGAGAPPPVR